MLKPRTPLFQAAELEQHVSTAADAIKAIDDKTMTISQRLAVARDALKGIDPTGQLATLKADIDKATLDLTASATEITALKAQLDTAQKQITALEADASEHEKALAAAEKQAADLKAKEQDLSKRSEARANEKLSELGFASGKLPSASEKMPAEAQHEDLRARFKAEADPLKKASIAKQLRVMEAKAAAKNN